MNASTKKNLLFTLIVLAVAGVWFAVTRLTTPAVPARTALLQYGSGVQEEHIDLNTDADYDFFTGYYTIHLQVRDGAIAFVESPCPDHVCEAFGWLRNPGDWAACLPATAMLYVEGEE